MKSVVVALALVAAGTSFAGVLHPMLDAAPVFATTTRDDVDPCADGRTPAPGERCRGPVDNESGGGGGTLTIVVSVVVGLAIAGVALIVLRRQLPSHRPPPRPMPPRPMPGGADSAPGAGERS